MQNISFSKIKFKYLEHDLWRHEGFLAHDNHVSIRKANAGLRVGRVFRVQAVAWRHCAVLLLRKSRYLCFIDFIVYHRQNMNMNSQFSSVCKVTNSVHQRGIFGGEFEIHDNEDRM